VERSQQRRFRARYRSCGAAIEYDPTRAGKRFLKKRLADLSNYGDAKQLRVQDK